MNNMNKMDDTFNMMNECKKEYERKNHCCNGKSQHGMPVNIILIEGENDLDIQEIKENHDVIENEELLCGWFIKNWRYDSYRGCNVYNFIKIEFCPLCGDKLLL
ncbi:hypothetical protein [Clostridium lacusfryxellense]|uniref:hypothetical protein n=1 Tax=Clostridium lacusfryxellense TaxID=205328 RepID=UPI001C0BB6F3|nr:hypothetical protein [Clostridium lacusfryxellense]MBU3114781.1 hypothetical protein [Clostridium lacusfryxellense]